MGRAGPCHNPADTLWRGLIREPALTLLRWSPLAVPAVWGFWLTASRLLGGVVCVPCSAAP